MAILRSVLESLRWSACMILLQYYVVPKTRLRAFISRLFGTKEPTLQHMLANATIRWLARMLSTNQFRAITSLSADADALLKNCPTLLEEKATTESIIRKSHRGRYVVKLPNSTHIIFYIYGGGFVSGSPGSVMPYLLQLSVELQSRGIQADIFVPEYDLAPENPYPIALGQVVSAYEHVASQNKPVILAGDSAGGNLCLALLRHLVKPHPSITAVKQTREHRGGIIGMFLVSPWVNLRNDSESCVKDDGRDCLDKASLDSWSSAYLHGQPLDGYANPIDCRGDWQKVLPQTTLLVSGELDLFVADIRRLSQYILESEYDNFELFIAPSKGHVWNLVDFGSTQAGKPVGQLRDVDDDIYAGIRLQVNWIVEKCIT